MAGQKRKKASTTSRKRKQSSKSVPEKPVFDSEAASSPLSQGNWSLAGFLVIIASQGSFQVNNAARPPDCSSRQSSGQPEICLNLDNFLDEATQDGFNCNVVKNDIALGGECRLGSQGEILVNGNVLLQPFISGEIRNNNSFETPSKTGSGNEAACSSSSVITYETNASSSKRRRVVTTFTSVTVQLQKLSSRYGLHVEGRVVKIVKGETDAPVAVLLDVYFPTAKFLSWKSGPSSTFVLSHLSSDWELRKSILNSPDAVNDRDVWNLPECRVLGCVLHPSQSQKSKFDLQEIFKGLSARDPKDGCITTGFCPGDGHKYSIGIWDVPDEVLMIIFGKLSPKSLLSMAAVCRHTRLLAKPIIPCMNLRLFPHQQAAVQWMLHRETCPGEFFHPLFKCLKTADDIHIYLNCINGELSLEAPSPVRDFRGGLFCDEPGLGKTITSLSLILKTQGLYATPPENVDVCWCEGPNNEKLGYYEVNSAASTQKRNPKTRRLLSSSASSFDVVVPSRNLEGDFAKTMEVDGEEAEAGTSWGALQLDLVWVQCDACSKWRKLIKGTKPPKDGAAWFCRMNSDPLYQACSVDQEVWDSKERVHALEGFYKTKGEPGLEQNVTFFKSVLKERANLLGKETRNALNWLANLGTVQLGKVTSQGLPVPQHLRMASVTGSTEHDYETLFQAFGLVPKQDKKKIVRWHYPPKLRGFQFDTAALKTALSSPVEETNRVYLSKATLVVVPANLIDHWRTQIERHTRSNNLCYCVCTEARSIPLPHVLAWDYDIVITTFSRLSAEWSIRENSSMMQVHWFRIILDEGHTLGASLALTNKLQMAINMHASRRWVLTGTPTPNTPNSQLVHLQPMLRFLHEQLYGSQHKLWDAAILRPFETKCEDGRLRLLQLLQRCMVCARKADLSTIPPCLRKDKLVEFTDKHAASYNLLVETVRRNILMADWNDPDHVESLLNQKQWKTRSTTLKNVRLSCCVAGHIKLENSNQDIQETMDMVIQDGVNPNSALYTSIRNGLFAGANCVRCDEWCRLPIVTPCHHFLCLACVSLDCQKCSLSSCGHPYKMQTPKARSENPNPKWAVPQDLIELQPSYIQDEWHPEWQATSSSKVAYLIEELQKVENESKKRLEIEESPEKVIVFSQFLEHLCVVESQLKKAKIPYVGMYCPMNSTNKMKALKNFQHDPNCLVLLMDGSSALGLDLSFVNRVYLMEPIWDRSIEEQVVSRAHRMGAQRPILVETLAMRGTIEEEMMEILRRSSSSRTYHDPHEGWYLEHLKFVRKAVD